MDTAAACRTYNILAAEGRHVIAALLLEFPQLALRAFRVKLQVAN